MKIHGDLSRYVNTDDIRIIGYSLDSMYDYIKERGFPCHSYSIIYRSQDLGRHIIFMGYVKDKVTDEMKDVFSNCLFTYSFVN